MSDDRPVPEGWAALPLLMSIAVTALVLAAVITWQAGGVPVVALLLVPWMLLLVALIVSLRPVSRTRPFAGPASEPGPGADGMAPG